MVWPIGEYSDEIREIVGQSDRATAVVGVALVDKILVQVVSWHRRPPHVVAQQSMAARIDQARAFRLVSAVEHSDCHKLRKIRNAFAHDTEIRSFAHQSITKMCDELQMPELFYPPLLLKIPTDPRERFVGCVSAIVTRLKEVKTAQKLHGTKLTLIGDNGLVRVRTMNLEFMLRR
jgi:hypothetical protein